MRAMKCSYSLRACSGRAAAMNDGRLPPRVSPNNVNWETARTAPSTSTTDRFILPSLSSKMRRPAILSATYSASPSLSVVATPRRTKEMLNMSPIKSPRSEEHTSELQSRQYLVCRLLLEKKKHKRTTTEFDE